MTKGDDRGSESVSPLRVVYVVGAGRSGSTVLDTILGSHPRVAGFGELVNLPRAGWINNEYCACGVRALDCPFWSAVRARWHELQPDTDCVEYARLQDAFTRFRRLPYLMAAHRLGTEAFRRYESQTVALFRSIADVADVDIVVDSSKSPVRGRILRVLSGLDVRFIHLVRDGRAVTWSYRKRHARDEKAGLQRAIEPMPTWRVAAAWTATNLLAETLLGDRAQRQSGRLRYETLVTRPDEALGTLEGLVGVDLSDVGARVASGQSVPVGHTIAGNRLRMNGSVTLTCDFSWEEELSSRDARRFVRLAGWMLRRYGYIG